MRRVVLSCLVLSLPGGVAWAGGRLAIGADGLGLISYYDDVAQDLKVAHCSNAACTSATLSVVDSVGDVGSQSAIAVGADGRGLIAYLDATNRDLKIAHCSDLACTAATVSVLDTAFAAGYGPSVAIGADGLPLVTYYRADNSLFLYRLYAAHCADVVCTASTLTALDTNQVRPTVTSVALGSDGLGLIVYDAYGSPGSQLRAAHCSNTACTAATTSVIATTQPYPLRPALAVGADGFGLVSYEIFGSSDPNRGVHVAHCADLACSAAPSISVSTESLGPSLARGADGLGLLAMGTAVLRAAHCLNAQCSAVQSSVLDPTPNLGAAGVALGSDGLGLIAYDEADHHHLKVAHCTDAACQSAQISTVAQGPPRANVSLSIADFPDPVQGLQILTYQGRVYNHGPDFAPQIRMDIPIPPSAEYLGFSGAGWACALDSGVLGCLHPGIPVSGPATPDLTVTVRAPPTAGVILSTVSIRADAFDPFLGNNTFSLDTTVTAAPVADLGIAMDDGGTVVRGGQPFTWTITASNTGAVNTSGTVTDRFPPGIANVSWTCTGAAGAGCPPGGTGDIVTFAILPVGSSAVFTATGTVTPGTQSLVNTVTIDVAQGVYDPNLANNSATVVSRGEPTQAYTVNPCRLVDTRATGEPLAANTTRTFPVAGLCGVPADARAVAINLTAVGPGDVGNLRLYPAGAAVPLSSSLNFAAGRTRANNAIVPLGVGGAVAVRCDMPPGSTASTHFVLDVYAYFK